MKIQNFIKVRGKFNLIQRQLVFSEIKEPIKVVRTYTTLKTPDLVHLVYES